MRIETREIVVHESDHGKRLDAYLAEKYSQFSRTQWQNRIDEQNVTVSGLPARGSRRLQSGEAVAFRYPLRDEPEVNAEIATIAEDENFLVVNKPPGLPVHPSGIYKEQTLTALLVKRGILETPHPLHRLDRETSGVLIMAKNRKAAAVFQKTLRSGEIDKQYLVAVEGTWAETIDATGFLYRLPGSLLPRQRFFSYEHPAAEATEVQTSRTVFEPFRQAPGMSLVRAKLYTGRMHQIRATVHSLGYPVVGDKLYGVDANLYFRFVDDEMTPADWQRLRIDRSALHCAQMVLKHPFTGSHWQLTAPLPSDIANLFPL
ncbi:RluA family pseudouridine synthase [Turneriella parva]|uniref:Pseudouridine synthase, RluA family n=1 Tax=Turneriella parva (strain ATCC BAA-1111 / DSM 21527 / NCTC 11395 / H) TaxID=869212 RepID=I4B438_TURPD|nr:RluA family pseudouridine synthase [Turneriella parva]AFM12045.1 pseudouridine synthase, RluA family [Turneriella parva DSM 21527]